MFQEPFSGHASDKNWATSSTDAEAKNVFFIDSPTGSTGSQTHQYKEAAGNLSFSSTKPLATMSVVDAMATPCYDGSKYVGSVFDMYASTEAKNTYASLIRSSSVSGNEIVMTDSGTFTPANNDKKGNQIDCSKNMQPRVLYTFMSVGKSSDGSGDAFRAYYSVSVGDTTAPMVSSVLYNGPEITGNKFPANAKLIVNFSEPLYTVVSSGNTQEIYGIDSCRGSAHSGVRDGFVSLASLGIVSVGASITTAKTHPAQPEAVTSITFDLAENARNATITFPPGKICDQSRNGLGRDQLTIQVSIKTTGSGDNVVYDPVVTLTKAWNGTSWGSI